MKTLALMKQRMLYKKPEESEEFKRNKRETLEMRDSLKKAAGFLQAWLEGAKAMQKASADMGGTLSGEDPDLEAIARVVQDGLANDSGAGVVEVALVSVNNKIGWLSDLKKKCDSMDTVHMELERANRKLTDNKDPAKAEYYTREQEICQKKYEDLKSELDASFKFVLEEAKAHSPNGQVHPLGLLYRELNAFKQSQKAFYAACHGVTAGFAVDDSISAQQIWEDFQIRRAEAIDKGRMASSAQSGRELLRQGLSGTESPMGVSSPSQRMNSPPGRGAPPPPPPPPPPVSSTPQLSALYDYQAQGDDELSFTTGTMLKIIDRTDPNWWMGEDPFGNRGLVPSNYLAV